MSRNTSGQSLDLQAVRNRVEQKLIDAFRSNDTCVIEALPASGKTYSTFKSAASTNTSIIYLASRTDLYDQAEKHCKRFGLVPYRLPAPKAIAPALVVTTAMS